MRHPFFLLLICISLSSFSQESLIFSGSIGAYPIELRIESNDAASGLFTGRYRYEGKESFIEIAGEYGPPIVYIEEYFKDDTTGFWYLELEGDSLNGRWVGNGMSLDVKMKYSEGDRQLLSRKTEFDYNREVSGALTGEYEVNEYFINDMWVSDENLNPELGYNGGVLTVTERIGSIEFMVEAVCGPTYHIAYAEGIAEMIGNEYVYRSGDCVITFVFSNKRVKVTANSSMDCEFGARAFLDHEFIKVSDKVVEIREE